MFRKSRFIAFLLAAVFFVSTPGPWGMLEAQAAGTDLHFTTSFQETMVKGTVSNNAPLYAIGTNKEEVFSKWDFEKDGTYYLRYFLDTGKQVVFRVTKYNNSEVDLSYRVFTTTGGALIPFTERTHRVYSFDKKDYVAYNDSIFDNNNPTSKWKVLTSKTAPNGTASFGLDPDTGFSMEMNGVQVHFFWSATNRSGYEAPNTFYYTTNGLTTGNIREMKLYYTSDLLADVVIPAGGVVGPANELTAPCTVLPPSITDNDNLSNTQYVLTGISGFTSTPTANSGKGIGDILTWPDDEPGDKDVELKIEFDMPKVWNSTLNTFAVPASGTSDAAFTGLVLNMINSKPDMPAPKTSLSIQIQFGDLFTSAAPIYSSGAEFSVNPQWDIGSNRYTFTLKNLPAGQIFNTTTLYHSAADGNKVNLRSTEIEYGKIYTFPRYMITMVDDQAYAVITPFEGHAGYYVVKQEDSVIAKSEKNDGITTILLPISSQVGFESTYQILFNSTQPFTDLATAPGIPILSSQKLRYKLTADDTTIGMPSNFEVVRYKQTFPKDDTDHCQLDMTLSWDIAKESTLQNLIGMNETIEIVYAVNRTWTPGETDHPGTNPFINVLAQITRTGTDDFSVKYFEAQVDANGAVAMNGGSVVTVPDADSRVVGGSGMLTYRIDTVTAKRVYQVRVDLQVQAGRAYTSGIDFVFPKIYFLNAQPILMNIKNVSQDITHLGSSLYGSITLNDYDVPEAPAPLNMQSGKVTTSNKDRDGNGKDEVSIEVKWTTPAVGLQEYVAYLYKGQEDKIPAAGLSYNLYVSQARFPDSFIEAEPREAKSKNADYIPDSGNVLYFSGINGVDDVLYAAGTQLRDVLRDRDSTNQALIAGVKGLPVSVNDSSRPYLDGSGAFSLKQLVESNVASGSALSLSYTVDGLDKNQRYYFAVELVIEEPDGNSQYSVLSSVLAEITEGDPDIMDPTDTNPPAPVFKEKEVENQTAGLSWDRVRENISAVTTEFYYQLIRTKEVPLSSEVIDDTSLTFDKVWSDPMLGFRTSGTDGKTLQIYEAGDFADLSDDLMYKLDTSQDPPTLKLVDNTLTTNAIYYYYIRTVRTAVNADGDDVTRYSKWNGISVTTDPVSQPINLKVEEDMEYNRQTEIIISFDAPFVDLAQLGTVYNLQYQLKADDGNWEPEPPTTMTASALLANYSTDAPVGYLHFTYKITGLTPSTLYSIRVRMQDLTNDDYSVYSNVAQTITDFDQKKQEEDQKVTDWSDYLAKELEQLLKHPYWVSKDSSSLFEAVYRPTMFDSFLAQGTGGLLQLVPSNADKAVYYLPASALLTANNRDTGFKITQNNMDVIFSPKSMDPNSQDAILQALNKIKDKSIADYYVRITLTWSNASNVEGDEALTKQVNVQAEVVGSLKDNKIWDQEQLAKLTQKVADKAKESGVTSEVLSNIRKGTSSEDMVLLVASIVEDAKKEFQTEVSSALSSIVRQSFTVEYLSTPLIIAAKGLDSGATVKAYQSISGVWLSQEVVSFGSDKAIYVLEPGIYVFTGHVINIPGLENLQGAGSLSAIIGKYGLDDFFGKDSNFNLEAMATRNQVANSIARMAGAPKGTDPFSWLSQNKGVTLSTRNANANIQNQESVYLVMALYEIRTGTKVVTIQIRNYSLTANMTGLDDNYKQSVRAAFELGLCPSRDFDPKSGMKVKEFLEILSSFDAKYPLK